MLKRLLLVLGAALLGSAQLDFYYRIGCKTNFRAEGAELARLEQSFTQTLSKLLNEPVSVFVTFQSGMVLNMEHDKALPSTLTTQLDTGLYLPYKSSDGTHYIFRIDPTTLDKPVQGVLVLCNQPPGTQQPHTMHSITSVLGCKLRGRASI
eukprot:m.106559 g.106559  ORF g.106559 m.106559 type:complete len:151 (-) comp9183_c0_seq7:1594-2046(-)